jgi:hypothetical protein
MSISVEASHSRCAAQVGHKPDYGALLQNIVARNPKGALDFALMLAQVCRYRRAACR